MYVPRWTSREDGVATSRSRMDGKFRVASTGKWFSGKDCEFLLLVK